jgi:hypothetical protein
MKKKNVKSLKQVYNEVLVCEMPIRLFDSYTQENVENFEKNHIEAEKYIKGTIGKLIDSPNYLEKIDIYQDESLTGDGESLLIYVLIHKNKKEIEGFTKLLKIKDNNNKEYFSTHGLCKKNSASTNLIFNFFTKWLLPKYKLIISDNGTTDLGERFWKEIIEFGLANSKECGIFEDNDIPKQSKEQFTRLYKIENFSNAWEEFPTYKRIYIKA